MIALLNKPSVAALTFAEELQYIICRGMFLVPHYQHAYYRDKLYVRGREVKLGRAEFDSLELLLSEPGRVYTYEQIYNYAQGDNASPESIIAAVHSYIKRIRRKIEADDTMSDYIQSVRSVGYRMALP